MAVANELIDAGPGLVRCPFTILIDRQEKAPFSFAEIRARSFIDKDQRLYVPCVERRYLGVGMGDYSLAGYEGRSVELKKSLFRSIAERLHLELRHDDRGAARLAGRKQLAVAASDMEQRH